MDDRTGKRRGGGTAGRWVGRIVAMVLLVLSPAWIVSGFTWPTDMAANLSAQLFLVTAVLGLWWLLRRRWGLVVVSVVSCVVHGIVLIERRAARGTDQDDAMRVLVYNAHTRNPGADALELILMSGADVVALTEPSAELLDLIRDSDRIHAEYPYLWLPDRARGGFRLLMSRWPQAGSDGSGAWVAGASRTVIGPMRVARIDRPDGVFMMVMAHPRSPRTWARWRAGNGDVEQVADAVTDLARSTGLPVVLAADLNATPTGWRSRYLTRRTGLRRCKPLLTPVGTYPASLPWPVSVAIDDAWVSPGVRVASWKALGSGGSDHRAVVVDLVLPKQ